MKEQIFQLMHELVRGLESPVMILLLGIIGFCLYEIGLSIGERFFGLPRLQLNASEEEVIELGRRRVERADFFARVGPMLGLMGTLIPLGPGLAALSMGDVSQLAQAVTTAFDTTVLGLLIGIIGFVLGRLRRRWYDKVLAAVEGNS